MLKRCFFAIIETMERRILNHFSDGLKRQGRRCVSLALVLILFFLGFINPTYAFRAIQIDQDRVRVISKPGTTYTGRLEVKNPSDEAKEVKAYLQDWVYSDDQGSKKILAPGLLSNSCANWIKFVPQEFTVPPFGRRVINYSVDIPADASGGYYALLFCESLLSKPEIAQQEEQTAAVVPVAVRIGVLFMVEIQGKSERKIEIKDLSLKRSANHYEINLLFENTGNVDIKASGNFSIMDKNGMVYGRGLFDNVYTLPKDQARFSAKWKDILARGSYDLILTIDLGKALQDYDLGRGPIVVKEAQIEIGENGEVVRVGELK